MIFNFTNAMIILPNLYYFWFDSCSTLVMHMISLSSNATTEEAAPAMWDSQGILVRQQLLDQVVLFVAKLIHMST